MARIDVGETFTVTTYVVDRATGNRADAPDITLRYRIGTAGYDYIATPTWISTGEYSADITPTESGNLYYRWDTDGAFDVASEGIISVRRSVFELSSAMYSAPVGGGGGGGSSGDTLAFVKFVTDIPALRLLDTAGQLALEIDGAIWEYDAADTTSVDDGVECIIDVTGRRYKLTSISPAELAALIGADHVSTIAAAQAASVPSFVKSLVVEERDDAVFKRWAAPMASLYPELEGLAWFDDAAGTRWMLKPGPFTTKMMGCKADGVTDDAQALTACAIWMNAGWSRALIVSDGVHLVTLSQNLSDLPASAWKTTLLTGVTGVADYQSSVPFVGLRNFSIVGQGTATIRMKDASCIGASIDTNNRMSWGLMNFQDCRDGFITGVTYDGNRLGQTHTSAIVSGAVNHGCVVWGDCKRMMFARNIFVRQGTLQTAGDKQGDGIYMRCGIEEVSILDNVFEDWGRWGVTLERGYPTPGNPTKGLYIRRNRFAGPFNEDGGVTLGAVDIESWQQWSSVHITDNVFTGSGTKISFGSSPDPFEQTCSDLVIEGNLWDLRGYVSVTVNTDTLIGIGASWGVITGSSVEKKRRLRGVRISNNTALADKGFGYFIGLTSVLFDGLSVVDNRVQSDVAAADGYALLNTTGAGIAGEWVVTGNAAVGKNCLNLNGWQDTFDNRSYTLTINDNYSDRATRGFDIQADGRKITATGTVATTVGSTALVGTGTLFRSELYVGQQIRVTDTAETYRIAHITSDTSARLDVVAISTEASSAYTRAAGLVDFHHNIAKKQSTTTGSTLTGNGALFRFDVRSCFLEGSNTIAADVITPGLGVATVPNAATSITVPHFSRADPTFMQAVSNGVGGSVARIEANTNLGTITITLAAAATADTPVSWMAHNGNGA